MAFLRTNYRKNQFICAARATVMADSAISYIAVNFASLGFPPPKALDQFQFRLHAINNPTYSIGLGAGSLDGNKFYLTLQLSNTFAGAAAWDSTFSIAGVYQWLIGSK